jgi:hypothetical protein
MKTRIFFIIIGAILLVGIGAAIFSSKKGNDIGEDGLETLSPKAAFAQCLTDNSAIFYGAFWCPHCQEQKKMFGSQAVKKLTYVECSTPDGKAQNQICKDADVKSYPTWKFADGTMQTGRLSFAQLAEKTGCVAPTE